jgi:dephospho-CoA kinase
VGSRFLAVAKILITGMSATGKSTVLEELGRRGHRVVDLDEQGWSVDVPLADGAESEQLWREDVVAALLVEGVTGSLFVAGCASNQGSFYDRFYAVVLLSVPREILLERIESRTTNAFGKTPAERQRILDDLDAVQPRLQATTTAEIETTAPLPAVADAIEAIAERVDRQAAVSRDRSR